MGRRRKTNTPTVTKTCGRFPTLRAAFLWKQTVFLPLKPPSKRTASEPGSRLSTLVTGEIPVFPLSLVKMFMYNLPETIKRLSRKVMSPSPWQLKRLQSVDMMGDFRRHVGFITCGLPKASSCSSKLDLANVTSAPNLSYSIHERSNSWNESQPARVHRAENTNSLFLSSCAGDLVIN